jgi:long-chain acyl-CoA synthetase
MTALEDGTVQPRGIHGVAKADPARLALVAGEQRVSYGALDSSANKVARALADVGVGHGDRVAVMLHNTPELFAVWNGIARRGALVVPISYRAAGPEVSYIVNDSEASALIYDDATVVAPELDELRGLRAAWHIGDPELWPARDDPPSDEFLGASVVTMNYTSGTTGRPKGIERPLPQPAREYPPNPFSDFWGFSSDDVHLLCGPAYHTAPGSYAQMHLGEGAVVVIMDRFTAGSCLDLIATERVTTSHMVPANFVRIRGRISTSRASGRSCTPRHLAHPP